MVRPRLFASPIAPLCAAILCGLACVSSKTPAAEAASPAAGATWKSVDESSSENPFRAKMAADWAPIRSQSPIPFAQPTVANQRSAPTPQRTGPQRVAPVRPVVIPSSHAQLHPVQRNASTPPTARRNPMWRLPNGQSAAPAANTSSTASSPNREPQPFTPPAHATQMARPTSPNQPASAITSARPLQRPSDSAAMMASPHRAPNPLAARPVANPNRTAMNHRGMNQSAQRAPHHHSQQSTSYSSRIWDTINVAFQDPGSLTTETVEPESLPLPNGSYHPDHEMTGPDYYDPGYAPGGCSCPGGCAECGTMCGDGGCGCEPGCGCGCGSACEPGCGCPDEGCNGNCDLNCIGPGDKEACRTVRIGIPKWQEFMIFGGVQGFKGPYDRERDSGNFGFNEGFNTGFKLPYTSMGYQIGYRAVHSQLHGDKDTDISDPHTQQFLTAGVFQRVKDGIQYGLAWDFLRDERWGAVDFHQLRGEVSLVDRGCHEWGIAAHVHLNEHEPFPADEETPSIVFQSTDQYLLFYRFHGARGGEGRFYGGFNDDDDGILGADMLIPLQDRWSLSAGFTYLIPDEPGGEVGAQQEAWNVGLGLVWHWDCAARSCHSNCYRPLFNVADNGSMIIDDRLGAPIVQNGDDNIE